MSKFVYFKAGKNHLWCKLAWIQKKQFYQYQPQIVLKKTTDLAQTCPCRLSFKSQSQRQKILAIRVWIWRSSVAHDKDINVAKN